MGHEKLRNRVFLIGLIVAAGASAGVRGQDADLVAGKRLFRSTEISQSGLTCWHCHANFNEKKTPDDYVRPGHPMYNVGHRSQFRRWDGERLDKLEAAIGSCMVRWMTDRKEEGYDGEPAPRPPHQAVSGIPEVRGVVARAEIETDRADPG
jgi:hypothetical protein